MPLLSCAILLVFSLLLTAQDPAPASRPNPFSRSEPAPTAVAPAPATSANAPTAGPASLPGAGPANLPAAAAPAWTTKLPARWTSDDAKQLLANSPWVKVISAGLARRQTEDELRDGGQMGQPQGPGYEHIDKKGSGITPQLSDVFIPRPGDGRSIRSKPGTFPIELRWESALPVRLAELRAGQDQLALEAEGYQIAVFGVPRPDELKDPDKWVNLKDGAALKREGKKDVKPTKASVFQREDGIVIIYVFPPSAELTRKDGRVAFTAQIGRIVISEWFDLAQMDFQGKLAL